MLARLIDDSKMAVGVNVNMNSCLSLCVSPVIVWQSVQGVPCVGIHRTTDDLSFVKV